MHSHARHSASVVFVPSKELTFVVGQNRSGQWLAVASGGSRGGVFADREAATRFATTETDRRPNAVRLSRTPIELRF